jgi:integrase
VRQRKTGRPVRFELTEHTRQAIDAYLKSCRKKPGEFLFTSPRSVRSMTPRQYGRLVSDLADRYRARPAPIRYALIAAN